MKRPLYVSRTHSMCIVLKPVYPPTTYTPVLKMIDSDTLSKQSHSFISFGDQLVNFSLYILYSTEKLAQKKFFLTLFYFNKELIDYGMLQALPNQWIEAFHRWVALIILKSSWLAIVELASRLHNINLFFMFYILQRDICILIDCYTVEESLQLYTI